jgi:nucleotide-binding universal stress UspA family protein
MDAFPKEEQTMSQPPRTENERLGAATASAGLFDRIVCGIDETTESLEAVRQASKLCFPEGKVALVAADELWSDAAGLRAVDEREIERALEAVLSRAAELAPDAERRLVNGPAVTALVDAAEEATLVVLGTHGTSRAVAVAIGSVGYRVLHDAPCSVLVARPSLFPDAFPASIAVGVDGSTASLAAVEEAQKLAERFGAEIRFIAAHDDKADLGRAREAVPDLVHDDRDAVDALVAAGGDADMVVVGSRGLHGLRSLGSVSERVAHKAPSSVLVVRRPEPA